MSKMPLCGLVEPRSRYTIVVTLREQKKHWIPNGDEFLTLESAIVREGELSFNSADQDLVSIEYCNFFKNAQATATSKVHEMKLKVISGEATSVQVNLSCSANGFFFLKKTPLRCVLALAV